MTIAAISSLTCRARRELADQYAISARLYAETVVLLTRNPTTGQKFEGLCRTAHEVWDRMEAARLAFEEHARTHGC